jgi:WhiB family transcriptional regulator, redox-sensing transcriptional regulator
VTFDEYLRRPRWMLDALCREHGDLDYFPASGSPSAALIAICAACLVRAECLADAVDRDEHYGVWGGETRVARLRLASVAA